MALSAKIATYRSLRWPQLARAPKAESRELGESRHQILRALKAVDGFLILLFLPGAQDNASHKWCLIHAGEAGGEGRREEGGLYDNEHPLRCQTQALLHLLPPT